jgi:uncharacterized membrane protein HdeD (DUF308 family)
MEASASDPQVAAADRAVKHIWWFPLVMGIIWVIVALVILQFDQASINTVGIIIGAMFLATGFQQLILAWAADRMKWLFALFGVLFLIAGVIALISPQNTFAALADILGFLFLLVGIFWIIQAFMEREVNPLWWMGLVAGILMVILGFWTDGQFFIHKAYVLLAFAGIWALMQGVRDIVIAFQLRALTRLGA